SPAWDPKGKLLYVLSDRYINPYLDRFEARYIVNEATLPCVIALQADGPLPFAPRSDTDPAKTKEDEKKAEERKDAEGKGKAKEEEEKKVGPIHVDFDGLAERLVQVPVAPANYDELRAVEDKLHWLKLTNRGMMPAVPEGDDRDPGGELQTY